jgi:hypothetical protein
MDESVDQITVAPLAGQVSAALAGAEFPLRRHHLVEIARENDAPRLMLTMLSALPDRLYRSLDEVEELTAPAAAAGR